MKKLISVVIAAFVSLSVFAGCTGGTGPAASSGEASPAASEQAEPANRLESVLASGKLTISTSPDYAPYEFIDPSKTGQEAIVGSDIMFAQYLADQLGVELVIETMDFSAALAAVQEGKVDLCISGLAYKEDRAQVMQLTDNYNMGSYQGVMVKKEAAEQYKTAADFEGKVIAAQNGSLQYENVEKQLPGATVEPITNLADGIMMLRTDKVDALSMSGSAGTQFAKNYDDIVMSEFKFEDDGSGTCVGVMNGEKELFDKINELIAQVNEEDLYAGWLEEASALSDEIMAGE